MLAWVWIVGLPVHGVSLKVTMRAASCLDIGRVRCGVGVCFGECLLRIARSQAGVSCSCIRFSKLLPMSPPVENKSSRCQSKLTLVGFRDRVSIFAFRFGSFRKLGAPYGTLFFGPYNKDPAI